MKDDIRLVMPFREGVLPIRYLGVPLVSKKISCGDCKVLIEVVQNRINDWKNKHLSFAGRLQLIYSVLSSLQVYWCTMFMLPKLVCNTIDNLCNRFLWAGGNNASGKVSVSWIEVCKPKSQGGLGIRPLQDWNTALMAKHLWNIVSNKNSIWVNWVKMHKLKGRNVWDIDMKIGQSWCWKQILKLRDKIKDFVNVIIGNGKCSVWFDKWNRNGPLSKLIDHGVIVQAGFSLNARVCDMIVDGNWTWPRQWEGRFDELIDVPVPTLNNDIDDKVIWCNKKGKEKRFCASEVWKATRIEYPKVMWYKHIWFSQCIPRHAFVTWVAIKGRLKTRDRLVKWGCGVDMTCSLCKVEHESHSHLFFTCAFSRRLWERLKPMALLDNLSNNWASIISGISNRPAGNKIWSVIQRLVFGASVYFVWQERNMRYHQQVERDVDVLFDHIVETVRMKIRGMSLKCTTDVIKASEIWNFPISKNVKYHEIVKELNGNNIFNED